MLEVDKPGKDVGGGVGVGSQRLVTGRVTHAAVLSRPVDHRLVVRRISFQHKRAAEQGHPFIPGHGSPGAGLPATAAARVRRPILPATAAPAKRPAVPLHGSGQRRPHRRGGQQEDAEARGGRSFRAQSSHRLALLVYFCAP